MSVTMILAVPILVLSKVDVAVIVYSPNGASAATVTKPFPSTVTLLLPSLDVHVTV